MNTELIEISHHLNRIPHLNITKYLPEVPLEEILTELLQFTSNDFYPYITGNKNKQLAEHMAKNWHGFCIIDSCNEGRHNVDYLTTENNFNKLTFNFDQAGTPVYAPTDVGKLMPKTISYLNSIINYPQKTRISRIMPNGGNATWHSHYKLALTGDKKFAMNNQSRLDNKIVEPVLHIPLITNPEVWFGISAKNPNFDKTFQPHWKHYNVGEVWLFNSFFHHNVYNNGDQPRDHIMMYVPFDDKKLLPIVKQAIDEYKGIRIPMESLEL
jgi:hypothetical protein